MVSTELTFIYKFTELHKIHIEYTIYCKQQEILKLHFEKIYQFFKGSTQLGFKV